MIPRRPLVLRHGGTSLRLKSLRRAALEPHRAAGFLALMHEAYPPRPDFDMEFERPASEIGSTLSQTV